MTDASIPRPRLTFAVGVTGHRAARLAPADRPRIDEQLNAVFQNIDRECRVEYDRNNGRYSSTAPQINLYTSLSDGADALAVRLRPSGWASIGILPIPEEQNIELLRNTVPPEDAEEAIAQHLAARAATSSITILPATAGTPRTGLARARDLMLSQIDLLIAVWDGQIEQSGGGTADVVAAALSDGIPVVWISAQRKQPPWLISHVTDVSREAPNANATSGPIAEAMRRQFGLGERRHALSDPWKLETPGASAETRLHDFLAEAPRDSTWFFWFDLLKRGPLRFWKWRIPVPCGGRAETQAAWSPFLDALPHGGTFRDRLRDILLPRCADADALATYYGHRYRSAYVLAYALSAVAVSMALLQLVLQILQAVPTLQEVLLVIELVTVVMIIGVVVKGHRRRWHDRWLDYRALAETLRHLRFLGLLGQYEKRALAEAAARPGAGWLLWYLRATMRELGVPQGELGPDYLREVMVSVTTEELDPQIEYHANNMKALNRLDHVLHLLGDSCFVLTAGILLAEFGYLLVGGYLPVGEGFTACINIKPWIPFATALLPAVGATITGIRFTGDFDGFARRSAQTGAELDHLRQSYDALIDRLDFDATADFIYQMARSMAADINGWTTLYGRKVLTLPS